MQDSSRVEKPKVVSMNTVPMSAALRTIKDGRRKDLIFVSMLGYEDGSWACYWFVYDTLTGKIEKYDKDSLEVV